MPSRKDRTDPAVDELEHRVAELRARVDAQLGVVAEAALKAYHFDEEGAAALLEACQRLTDLEAAIMFAQRQILERQRVASPVIGNGPGEWGRCPRGHGLLPFDNVYCQFCGSPGVGTVFFSNSSRCDRCGTARRHGSKFCQHCGFDLRPREARRPAGREAASDVRQPGAAPPAVADPQQSVAQAPLNSVGEAVAWLKDLAEEPMATGSMTSPTAPADRSETIVSPAAAAQEERMPVDPTLGPELIRPADQLPGQSTPVSELSLVDLIADYEEGMRSEATITTAAVEPEEESGLEPQAESFTMMLEVASEAEPGPVAMPGEGAEAADSNVGPLTAGLEAEVAEEAQCPACGSEASPEEEECPVCGYRLIGIISRPRSGARRGDG